MSGSHVSDAVLDEIAGLLYRRIGLRPEPTLRGRLRRCIRDDAAAHGEDVDAYLSRVRTQSETLQGLINRVTVQETSFFRHAEHFDVLARHLLPALGRPVTLWSAGCANGQEAFSLAMLLDEQGIDGTVLATDVSTSALRRTAAARYAPRELTGLSSERIARHLHRVGTGWEVNLLDPLPPATLGCQVVFCRNVLIYFTPESARAFLDRLIDRLPNGAVFLGSAESIWPVSDRFEAVPIDGSYFYRRRGEAPKAATRTALTAPRQASGHRPPKRSNPIPPPRASTTADDVAVLEVLTRAGQQAAACGDHDSAVTQFRKCTYLAPNDPTTHLHLALALDAAGANASAQRAYAAARRALLTGDPAQVELVAEGYTATDLLHLLNTKLEVLPH
jgi:chemotaxis protein methyltransferase CheR